MFEKFLKFKKYSAFSIIELLLTVSVILIIGTYSAVFFVRFLNQNTLANTQDQLLGQIRKAQLYAMVSKNNGAWGVNYTSPTITLFQGNSYATRNTAYDEKFTINGSTTVSGLSDIVFTRKTGIPSASSFAITITNNAGTKNISVNQYGIASR